MVFILLQYNWHWPSCDDFSEPNACVPNPCQNGATCHSILVNEYHCECTSGYYGDKCDFSKYLKWHMKSIQQGWPNCGWRVACGFSNLCMRLFCFTSPQPVRTKEASDSVSTIRDVMPLTVELTVRFSLRTQCTVSAARQALTALRTFACGSLSFPKNYIFLFICYFYCKV